jgi:tetratricopeptide (TPR) repeat protein
MTADDSAMPRLLFEAAKYNDKGVALLDEGLGEQAIAYFNKGLQACREIAKKIEAGPDLNYRLSSSNISLDACMKTSSSDDESSSTYYIHRHAIVLPTRFLRHHLLDTFAILPAILIFNQALAHHLVGLTKRDSRWFKKSVKLYETGFNHVMQKEMWDLSACYVLACLNNIAVIYCSLNQMDTAHRCFQQLLSTLLFLVNTEHQSSNKIQVYFQTVSHLMCEEAPTAAAA